MFIYDFGIRSIPPCGDCDTDGRCTMNCGPAIRGPSGNETGTARLTKTKIGCHHASSIARGPDRCARLPSAIAPPSQRREGRAS